jgi:MoxR-like ATPase
MIDLRTQLRAETVIPSDRRWKQSIRLVQAAAFLNGRDRVDDDDLQILQHVLWDVESQIPTVRKKVLALTSPITRGALDQQAILDEISAEVDARKGQSADTRAQYGGEAQFKVAEVIRQLDKLEEEGNRAGRSTSRLSSVHSNAKALKAKIYVECLSMPAEAAQRMANKKN